MCIYDNNNNSDSNDDDGDRVCTVRNVHMNRNILIRRFVRGCAMYCTMYATARWRLAWTYVCANVCIFVRAVLVVCMFVFYTEYTCYTHSHTRTGGVRCAVRARAYKCECECIIFFHWISNTACMSICHMVTVFCCSMDGNEWNWACVRVRAVCHIVCVWSLIHVLAYMYVCVCVCIVRHICVVFLFQTHNRWRGKCRYETDGSWFIFFFFESLF